MGEVVVDSSACVSAGVLSDPAVVGELVGREWSDMSAPAWYLFRCLAPVAGDGCSQLAVKSGCLATGRDYLAMSRP